MYNIIIVPLLLFVVRLGSPFFPKWKQSILGRIDVLERWNENFSNKIKENKRVLCHVASVGEYEQILPVMEYLQKNGALEIVLSYFSPSIKKIKIQEPWITYSDYLPWDRKKDQEDFFSIVNPDYIILNRYDIWPNFMNVAKSKKIPVALCNASTPPLGFWGWCSTVLRWQLFRTIRAWTFVDISAAKSWNSFIGNGVPALVTGNPRVDRALTRIQNSKKLTLEMGQQISRWSGSRDQTIIAGSTWKDDEEIVVAAYAALRVKKKWQNLKLLIVPHEVEVHRVNSIEKLVQLYGFESILFSLLPTLSEKHIENIPILIVDSIGFLAELYAFGGISFVGGGFGKSVHSVIEPAAHLVPVFFGPNYQRMPEAEELIILGAARSMQHNSEARNQLAYYWESFFENLEVQKKTTEALRSFLEIHQGAAERVGSFLLDEINVEATQKKGDSSTVSSTVKGNA